MGLRRPETYSRVSYLKKMELAASDGVVPVDDSLGVVVVQIDVSGGPILQIIYL